MSIKEELEMYQNALDAISKIPDNYQSRYCYDFKTELEFRVRDLKAALKHIK